MSSTFLSAASPAPDVVSEACQKETDKLDACVQDATAKYATLGEMFEVTFAAAEECYEKAADADAELYCAMPVSKLLVSTCPSEAKSMDTSCTPTSFKFEDFALNFAEKLKDGE